MIKFFKRKDSWERMTNLQRATFCIYNSVNPNENEGGQDDSLMALEYFDYNFVEQFLEFYIENKISNEDLIDSAEESLNAIRLRKKRNQNAV